MGGELERNGAGAHFSIKVNSAFHPSGVGRSCTGPGLWPGLQQGVFTCVGWQSITVTV